MPVWQLVSQRGFATRVEPATRMIVTTTLILYAGIAGTVYYFLLLFALVTETQTTVSWVKTPFLALRALLLLDSSRKVRSCVLRFWLALIVLSGAAVALLGINYSWFD